MLRAGAGGVSASATACGASPAMTPNGVDINPRVYQIAPTSLLPAGADPNQSWLFAGDSLSQPIVGRDRRDAC